MNDATTAWKREAAIPVMSGWSENPESLRTVTSMMTQ